MKKIIPLLVLLIVAFACSDAGKAEQAKMSENELRSVFNKDMSEYLRYINAQDYDKAFDFLPDAIFKLSSKRDLMQVYEQMEDNGMRLEMKMLELTDISKVKTKDNDNYCRFNYEGTLIMYVSGEMADMKGLLLNQFESQYENARGREYDDRIEIDITQTVFAVSVEGSADWKYVEYNNTSKAAIDKVIPMDVVKELL